MREKRLEVYIAGERAGTLFQHNDGSRSYSYLEGYDGIPLSVSIPVANREYPTRLVDAFFMGLLPDEERVRREAGRRFGVSANNPFALLAHMGLDCPGAVQVCTAEDAHLIGRTGELRRLSEEEIAERLDPKSGRSSDTWFRDQERWSLGGAQSKFALRKKGNEWYECHGASATTHILKPGIAGMRLEALDEYLTMRLAQACGIPSEHVEYMAFCGVPALVATRYDRLVMGNEVLRIHQEDLCQALSVTPDKKYAEDGGPSTPDILGVLHKASNPTMARESFAAMLYFNYLTCSPDAHAKNYSLLHPSPGQCVLAPLYDAASALPYELTSGRPLRMAMSIGGENRQGLVGKEQVVRFAHDAKLDADRCLNLMANLCERIIARARPVADDAVRLGATGVEELVERLVPRLVAHCRLILQQIS